MNGRFTLEVQVAMHEFDFQRGDIRRLQQPWPQDFVNRYSRVHQMRRNLILIHFATFASFFAFFASKKTVKSKRPLHQATKPIHLALPRKVDQLHRALLPRLEAHRGA